MAKLDDEMLRTAVRAFEAGAPLREIAESLVEMGYEGPRGGTLNSTTIRPLLIDAGCKMRGRERSRALVKQVIALAKKGVRQVDIAKAVGRSQPTVSIIIREWIAGGRK